MRPSADALLLPLLFVLIGAAIEPGHAATLDGQALASHLLKVVLTRTDGSRELGSAVSIAGDGGKVIQNSPHSTVAPAAAGYLTWQAA